MPRLRLQAETGSHFRSQPVRIVLNDIETTAAPGSIHGKGCDDGVPAGPHGGLQGLQVRPPVRFAGHEVEQGPIVPQRILAGRPEVPDVCIQPRDNRRALAEALPACSQRSLGNVEHGDIPETPVEQPAGEHRGTTSDIDDRIAGVQAGFCYQIERTRR